MMCVTKESAPFCYTKHFPEHEIRFNCIVFFALYIFRCTAVIREISIALITFTDDPRSFGIPAQMRFVADLATLPQTLLFAATRVEPLGTTVVDERRDKLGEILCLGAALQHGTHHGRHLFIPAVVAHCPPAGIAVNFYSPGTAVQTSCQSDRPHLCTDTDNAVYVT